MKMTIEQNALIELAECVKELIRLDLHYGPGFEGTPAWSRLDKLYKKASETKRKVAYEAELVNDLQTMDEEGN